VFSPIAAGVALVLTATPIATDPSGSTGGTDAISYLLQGGPFAAVLALILLDKLTPTGERNRLREEVKEYKQNMAELNAQLLNVLPPLTEMLPILRGIAESRSDSHDYAQQPRRGA
jgi:hypothetical protein